MTSGTRSDASELDALHAAVRELVAGCGGTKSARDRLDTQCGFDERAWRLLGVDMGLAGLGIAETSGGAGGGLAELTAVAEELGRALLPVPFLSSTVLAGQLLTRCSDPVDGAGAEILQRLVQGAVVAFAGTDADGCWRADAVSVHADGAGRLHGTVDFVLDGVEAEYFLVAAQTDDDGCELFALDATDVEGNDVETMTRRALRTLDPSRAQAQLVLDGAIGTRLTTSGSGAAIVDAALDVTLVVLAAEQVGGAMACLDAAVAYSKIRHQFSRPIGSFQAIKHKLADLLLMVEMARSAVDRAIVVQDDPVAFAEAAALAKVWCSEAYTEVAAENVHVNGGTGFTWEHDAHLFFRRARADAVLFGGPDVHRERLAQLLSW